MICGLVLERNWPLVSSDLYHIGLRAQKIACHMCPSHWNASWGKGIGYIQERILGSRPLSMKSKRSFVPHTGSIWKRLLPPSNDEDSMGANAAGKATVWNSYLQSVFTGHVPLDLKQRCQNQCDRVLDHTPNRTPFQLQLLVSLSY